MRFHSHMLRDTYAVELLGAGMGLYKLSWLLTHQSIEITRRYYSPWVRELVDATEAESVLILQKQGF